MGNKGGRVVPPLHLFLPAPVVFGPYFLIEHIGSGSFGEVFLAVMRRDFNMNFIPTPTCRELYALSPNLFAIKRFRHTLNDSEAQGKSSAERKELLSNRHDDFVQERANAAWLQKRIGSTAQQNVVAFVREVPDDETSTAAMVFDYCNCGDMRRLLARCMDPVSGHVHHFSLFEALSLCKQLALCVKALSDAKFVHRDLSLRHFFLHCTADGTTHIKVGDFGLRLDLNIEAERERAETAPVNSPRAPKKASAKGKTKSAGQSDDRADVSALGVVFYELLSLVDLAEGSLFAPNTLRINAERALARHALSALSPRYSGLVDVVRGMLESDPSKRLTAAEVCKQLDALIKQVKTSDRVFRPVFADLIDTCALECTAEGDGVSRAISGPAKFTIWARDRLGQQRARGGDRFVIEFKAPAPNAALSSSRGAREAKEIKIEAKDKEKEKSGLPASSPGFLLTDNNDGSYSVSYDADKFVSGELSVRLLPGYGSGDVGRVKFGQISGQTFKPTSATSPERPSIDKGFIAPLNPSGEHVLGSPFRLFGECAGALLRKWPINVKHVALAYGPSAPVVSSSMVTPASALAESVSGPLSVSVSGSSMGSGQHARAAPRSPKEGDTERDREKEKGTESKSKSKDKDKDKDREKEKENIEYLLHVAHRSVQGIEMFDATGALVRQYPAVKKGHPLCLSIALDSDGLIYGSSITWQHDSHRVRVFGFGGAVLNEWGRPGAGEGQFTQLGGLAVDSKAGEVYVSDQTNHRIQVFTREGKFLRMWGKQGEADGEFNSPRGVAWDPLTSRLYVADWLNHRVQVFDRLGKALGALGRQGRGDGQFLMVYDVAVGPCGRVYVADHGNNRVQVFDRGGNFVLQWTCSEPRSVVVSPQGIAYVFGVDGLHSFH